MRYSLTAGGKRLRPILCLASADAVGGERALALPAACAVELIHTYSLIHDDLPAMDNDTMRRGRPTLHVVAGEGMAILAGDGLLTEAFNLLTREPRGSRSNPRRAQAARHRRHLDGRRPAGMVGGQAIDLAAVTPSPLGTVQPPLDQQSLQIMHAKKTGALIRAAAIAGAIMGGGDEAQISAIDRAAAEFGPCLPDRRRRARRRRRVVRSRQDGRQGRRGRQADLSVAVRRRGLAPHGRGMPATRRGCARRRRNRRLAPPRTRPMDRRQIKLRAH